MTPDLALLLFSTFAAGVLVGLFVSLWRVK